MNYVNLGKNGPKISPIVIGCMSFAGNSEYGNWDLNDEDKVLEILKKCYDSDLRTFDTADMYANGVSELLVGKFLKKYDIPRDTVVILSKCYLSVDKETHRFLLDGPPNDDPYIMNFVQSNGLSRQHILDAVRATNQRLCTHIDVLQIHRFDSQTPMRETMETLNDIITQGLARYVGASSIRPTRFAQLQFIAERFGYHKFISVQNYYNLLYREEEREMIPYCKENGIGVLCLSPLARNILTKPLKIIKKGETVMSDLGFSFITQSLTESDEEILTRLEKISIELNCKMIHVAIAWVISKGGCPILGLPNMDIVDDALGSLQIQLTDTQIKYLEEPYIPRSG